MNKIRKTGWKLSDETKHLMSIKRKGIKLSDITKDRIRLGHLGLKRSKETLRKMSLAHMGQKNAIGSKARTGQHWKVSDEIKKKMSDSHKKGEENHRWIKDRTQLKRSGDRRRDSAYCYWRKEIYKRDNWQCRLSNNDCNGRLEAHHILNWIDYPELRYIINNGITLCHSHHPRKWEEEKRMIPIFQELLSVSKE